MPAAYHFVDRWFVPMPIAWPGPSVEDKTVAVDRLDAARAA